MFLAIIGSKIGRVAIAVIAFVAWTALVRWDAASHARAGYVARSELTAAQAELTRERNLRRLADQLSTDYEKRLTTSENAEAKAQAALDAEIKRRDADVAKKPARSGDFLDTDDLNFVLHH